MIPAPFSYLRADSAESDTAVVMYYTEPDPDESN